MNKKKYETPEEYEKDLYETLRKLLNEDRTAENILTLKKIMHGVNTHITYLIGEKFLESLSDKPIKEFQYKEMCSNGFDIELEIDGKPIIAEIKGNLPLNIESYGAQQRDGIIKDIGYLTNGKLKSKNHKPGKPIKNVYRFLILLENNRNAIQHLINNLCKKGTYNHNFFKIEDSSPINRSLANYKQDVINVIFIEL